LNKEELVLSTVLSQNDRVLSENLLYFDHAKFLLLQKPEIKTEIAQTNSGFEIELRTNTLAKSVYLSLPDGEDDFSDNYFDLLPNEKVKIKLNTNLSINELKSKLSIRSLSDSF
jgi:beta-mannosidase